MINELFSRFSHIVLILMLLQVL